MLSKNIVNFIGCGGEYEESRIVIFGAPFDSTHPSGREPGLEARPSGMNPMALRHTVLIRKKT